MVDDNGLKEDKFEFDLAGEAIEYVSLEQAELLAMREARNEPGNYGSQSEGVGMVYVLDDQEEREDYYVITLSFRPEGNWKGSVGQEQFFIEKEGVVAHRQVLSLPKSASSRRLLSLPVIIIVAVVVIAGGVSSVIASGIFSDAPEDSPSAPIAKSAGDDASAGLPVIAPTPSSTPEPTAAAQVQAPIVVAPQPSITPTPVDSAASVPTISPTPVPPVPTDTPAPVPQILTKTPVQQLLPFPTVALATPAPVAVAPTAAPVAIVPVAIAVPASVVPAVGIELSQPSNLATTESTGITFWSDLAAGCKIRGGHLKVGNRVTEFTNLNPPTINQVIQFSITAEVLSGLVQLNPELNPVPDLAVSWDISSDLLTYRFKLRGNAKFHDGRPVTADDWVFTYDHYLDPETPSFNTRGLQGVSRPVKIDDYTLEISSEFPRASFLTKVVERASGRVMTLSDKETIARVGEGGFNRMPVGAGPFRITDHAFGERLEFEAARDTYYDPSVPCVDSLTHFNIPEDNTLIASLATAQVDAIYGFPSRFQQQLEEDSNIIVDGTPDVGFQMLAFNMRGDREGKTGIKDAPWDDINVIYALGRALDRTTFIERAFQGNAIPSYGAINPGLKFYFRDLSGTSRRTYDPDSARQLMKDAGFLDGFEVQVLATIGDRDALAVLGELWKEEINVTLVPDLVVTSAYHPKLAFGEFEAFMGGSGGDPDPDDAIDDWFAAGSKFNYYGYNDEVINSLNVKQKAAVDLNDRLDFILQISDRMDETFRGIFTHHRENFTAYRADVKGYTWIYALRQYGAVWLDR